MIQNFHPVLHVIKRESHMKSESDHIELDKVWSYNRLIHLHDKSVSITL